MQLGSKESENERFAHYLTKTYRKTASLIANSLKSVSSFFVCVQVTFGYQIAHGGSGTLWAECGPKSALNPKWFTIVV